MSITTRKLTRIGMLVVVTAVVGVLFVMVGVASASVVGGPDIISAPAFAQDSVAFNTNQQAFNERQNVVLPAPVSTDSGSIAQGTCVNSHMIFFNLQDDNGAFASELDTLWTFDSPIIGVMSDRGGNLEFASTPILGAQGTTYPVAAFADRGLENNDSYNVVGNTITVSMSVVQPGDWIRVVTQGSCAVGGATTFLTESSDLSAGGMIIVAGAAGAFAFVMGGGWYAWRRWLGQGTA